MKCRKKRWISPSTDLQGQERARWQNGLQSYSATSMWIPVRCTGQWRFISWERELPQTTPGQLQRPAEMPMFPWVLKTACSMSFWTVKMWQTWSGRKRSERWHPQVRRLPKCGRNWWNPSRSWLPRKASSWTVGISEPSCCRTRMSKSSWRPARISVP